MTKIILVYELSGEGVSKSYIAKRLGVSRRTIIRWSKAIAEHGSLDAFLVYYQQAKKGSRQKGKRCAPTTWAGSHWWQNFSRTLYAEMF